MYAIKETDLISINKTIIDFMGYEETTVHVTDSYGYHQAEEGYIIPNTINHSMHVDDTNKEAWNLYDLRFHTDWNWLMPVVAKCYKIHREYEDIFKASDNPVDRLNNIDIKFKFDSITFYTNSVDSERCLIEIVKFIKELENVKKGSNE